MLSERAALAILLAPFALLGLEWSQREAPSVPCGAFEDPAREAWLSGLAPAAFVTGCICLVVVLKISAGTPTLIAVAAWLAFAAWWWIVGEASLVSQWAFFAYLLLLPGIPFAVALIAAILIRPSWTLVRVLAWLCAVVLVPGLVGVIDN
jgi:hypothetical protein